MGILPAANNIAVASERPRINPKIAVGIGLLLWVAAIILAFTNNQLNVLQEKLVVGSFALGAGGIATGVPGFLNVNLQLGKQAAIGAAGAIGVFIILYFFAPGSIGHSISPKNQEFITAMTEEHPGLETKIDVAYQSGRAQREVSAALDLIDALPDGDAKEILLNLPMELSPFVKNVAGMDEEAIAINQFSDAQAKQSLKRVMVLQNDLDSDANKRLIETIQSKTK